MNKISAFTFFIVFLPLPLHAKTLSIETSMGTFTLELYENETPETVKNFMNYVDDGDFINSFFHRSVPGFVLQGGGFKFENNQFLLVPTDAPINNEFSHERSNVRGTLAMAKLGNDPNSATSQWFINLADNSANLDNQNGGFTVFGKVSGNGMNIIDQIATLPVYDITSLHSAFSHVPLNGFQGTFDPENQLVSIKTIEDISVETVPFPPTALVGLGMMLCAILGFAQPHRRGWNNQCTG